MLPTLQSLEQNVGKRFTILENVRSIDTVLEYCEGLIDFVVLVAKCSLLGAMEYPKQSTFLLETEHFFNFINLQAFFSSLGFFSIYSRCSYGVFKIG